VADPTGTASDELAGTIALLRKKRRWTLRDLADACEALGADRLTENALENIEYGRRDKQGRRRRDITVDELVVFAAVFGMSPADLLSGRFCKTCVGVPPAGFTCNDCRRGGDE
jgi:transcriptional regulator with XRE-family HTH domain